jgi:hypothetical protein
MLITPPLRQHYEAPFASILDQSHKHEALQPGKRSSWPQKLVNASFFLVIRSGPSAGWARKAANASNLAH